MNNFVLTWTIYFGLYELCHLNKKRKKEKSHISSKKGKKKLEN